MPRVSFVQPDGMEQAMLEFVHEPSATWCLACQIMIHEALDGLIVHLPAQQG